MNVAVDVLFIIWIAICWYIAIYNITEAIRSWKATTVVKRDIKDLKAMNAEFETNLKRARIATKLAEHALDEAKHYSEIHRFLKTSASWDQAVEALTEAQLAIDAHTWAIGEVKKVEQKWQESRFWDGSKD